MAASPTIRFAHAIALIAPAALLAGAYISQFGFGLYPCEMCWWQRYPHFVAVALALAAFAVSNRVPLLWLAALAIAVSGVIGAFHAGVEYGWWEGVSACAVPAGAGGQDALDAILQAPVTRCDVAPWTFLGVSLAGWNFLFSAASALSIAMLLSLKRKATM